MTRNNHPRILISKIISILIFTCLFLYPGPDRTRVVLQSSVALTSPEDVKPSHKDGQVWKQKWQKLKKQKKESRRKRLTTGKTILQVIGTIAVILIAGLLIGFIGFLIAYALWEISLYTIVLYLAAFAIMFFSYRLIRRTIWGKRKETT